MTFENLRYDYDLVHQIDCQNQLACNTLVEQFQDNNVQIKMYLWIPTLEPYSMKNIGLVLKW